MGPHRVSQIRVLFLGASVIALLSGSSTAFAQCAPNPSQSGVSTDCTGTETNGLLVITNS